MRTSIVLFFTYLYFSTTTAISQNFLDTNNTWTIEQSRYVFALNQTIQDTFTFFFDNEVDINGTTYLELKSNNEDLDEFLYYAKYFREEDQKIYMRTAYDNIPEVLFYDFGLVVGDTMWYSQSEAAVVITKDIIQLEDGIDRNRWELEWLGNVSSTNSVWIEGIGSLNSPINPKHILFQDVGFELLCYEYNNEIISGTPRCDLISTSSNNLAENEVKIFPNPFNSILNLENISPNSIIRIYNAFGQKNRTQLTKNHQLNTSQWPTGIYFISITNQSNKPTTFKVIKTDD